MSHWNSAGTSALIQAGDQVYAKLSRAGVDDHELPLTVSLTAQYTANVSANLMDMANGASAANAFLRITLQNCGTNNPQILGARASERQGCDTKGDSASTVAAEVIEKNGRHEGTRTPDLYRVKIRLLGFTTTYKCVEVV